MIINKYIKNAVLALILIALLTGVGAYVINGIAGLEMRKSTYTKTSFDFHIASPSAQQVDEIGGNGSVESIFPYYAYSKAFARNDRVMLLVSDRMDSIDASTLTQNTLIEGSYNKGGAMLDKTAADALGVSVGEQISFTLLGQKITREVSAIYLPTTLDIMEKGIVLVSLDSEIESVGLPSAYSGAFVVAEDKDSLGALLSDYAGEGNITLSLEQYKKLYCGSKLPNQSQDEYEAQCLEKYERYRADVLASAKKDGGQAVDKSEAYGLLKEKILTTEKSLSTLKATVSVAGVIICAISLILFAVTSSKNDSIRRDEGLLARKMFIDYALSSMITAVSVSVISLLALVLIASTTYFKSECISVALSLALPILLAAVPVLIALVIYVRRLYSSSVSNERKE